MSRQASHLIDQAIGGALIFADLFVILLFCGGVYLLIKKVFFGDKKNRWYLAILMSIGLHFIVLFLDKILL